MKKLSVLLALLLVMSCVLQVSAAEVPMSDQEYEARVAEILVSYAENPEAAKRALAELDTELIAEPQIVQYAGNSTARGTSPSDYDLSVSSFKRSNSTRIYLQWILTANKTETLPGPLDYVSLEWDTAYGTYYLSSTGGTGCTVQGRDKGIVLFNVEDDKLEKGNYVYGTVQVTPIITGWMEFGSKFVHTYATLNATGSATYSYTPSISANGSLGLSYTNSYTVTISGDINTWQLWADNATDIYDV